MNLLSIDKQFLLIFIYVFLFVVKGKSPFSLFEMLLFFYFYFVLYIYIIIIRIFYAEDHTTNTLCVIKARINEKETEKEFQVAERLFQSCEDKNYIVTVFGYQKCGYYLLFSMEYCDMGVCFF